MTIHIFWFTDPRDNKYDAYQFSNQEIQKNFLLEFSKYDEVVWHHCNARGRVTSNPDDILIGHPQWPPGQQTPYNNWVFDNGLDGPGSAHPNSFIVFPWWAAVKSHSAIDNALEMILHCRALFGMGGVNWYDENVVHAAADTQWRRTQDKFIRINMGCDARLLPHKTTAHKRTTGMFHVSSLLGYKRPELMLDSLPREDCTLYIGTERLDVVNKLAGEGRVPGNVRLIGKVDNGDPALNKYVLENCSYYLHCAKEAQATTILENSARGLVPLLTPQSGFSCPDAVYLTENPEENRRIIRDALAMPDEEYWARSQSVRQHIAQYHSWQRICQSMYVAIRALMAGQDVPRRGDDYS